MYKEAKTESTELRAEMAQLKKAVEMNKKADLESIEILKAKVQQLEKGVEMNKKADLESKGVHGKEDQPEKADVESVELHAKVEQLEKAVEILMPSRR